MSERIRVIHVVTPGPEELREHLAALTAGLAARRLEPIVLGPLDRTFRDELSRRGVRWVNSPLPDGARPREVRPAAEHLRKFLQAASPALVHTHGAAATVTAFTAVSGLQPRPGLISGSQGFWPAAEGPGADRASARRALRRVLRRCDAVIVSSEAEAGELARAGVAERVRVVPPGVEPRRRSSVFDAGRKRRAVGLHQDASVVVLKAPLRAGEAVEEFVRAAALVGEEVANVEFAVIGDGPLLEPLKQLAHELRLSGSTAFLGRRPDALDIIAACNVLVVLSEGPEAAIQALHGLTAGLRLVVADRPGLRELFGALEAVPRVEPGDARAFADALLRQIEGMAVTEDEIEAQTGIVWGLSEVLASQDEFDLDKPGLAPRDRRRQAAPEIARVLAEHSVERMVSATVEVYREVLER